MTLTGVVARFFKAIGVKAGAGQIVVTCTEPFVAELDGSTPFIVAGSSSFPVTSGDATAALVPTEQFVPDCYQSYYTEFYPGGNMPVGEYEIAETVEDNIEFFDAKVPQGATAYAALPRSAQ